MSYYFLMAQDQIIDAVVVSEPTDKPTRQQKDVIKAEYLPAAEYDQVRESGRLAGTSAGQLFFTQIGRAETAEQVETIRKHLKDTTVGGILGKRNPKNDQVLWRVDENNNGFHDEVLEENRLNLKRARQILKHENYVLLEDNLGHQSFKRSVFETGVKDGWEETKQKSEFPDEKPDGIPWFF